MEYLNEEHRRAIHQHEIARPAHTGAERFGPCVDGSSAYRGALRQLWVTSAASAVTRRDHLAGPGEAAAAARPSITSAYQGGYHSWAREVVERIALAGRSGDRERIRPVSRASRRTSGDCRRRALDHTSGRCGAPKRLRPDRLGRQRRAAARQNLCSRHSARSAPRSRLWRAYRCRRGWPVEPADRPHHTTEMTGRHR